MAGGVISGGWLSDRLVARWGARRGRTVVPVAGMIAGAILLVVGVAAEAPLWVMIWFSLGVFTATAGAEALVRLDHVCRSSQLVRGCQISKGMNHKEE